MSEKSPTRKLAPYSSWTLRRTPKFESSGNAVIQGKLFFYRLFVDGGTRFLNLK